MYRAIRTFAVLMACALSAGAGLWGQEAQEASGGVALIVVSGDIDTAKVVFVRRSLARAERDGASAVVIELSTFGGAVDAALRIATLIGSVTTAPTAAYIAAGAEGLGVSWSAGALIALSCRRIYMAPGTSMGAAAPVYLTEEGTVAAPEKEVSALRAQMAALAEKNGYPSAAALAMVDKDVELVELVVQGSPLLATSEEVPGLEREALRRGETFERGRTLSPAGKLLTLTAGEMERYGLSSGTVSSRAELPGVLGFPGSRLLVHEETVPDRVVAVLAGQLVTALLLIVGIIALYLELSTPGFGVPGTVALICFATIFAAGGLLGTLDSLELIMFIAGVALLLLELFVIPGFGAAGVAGILLIAMSVVLSRQEFILPRLAWDWDRFLANTATVIGSLFASFVIVAVLMRFFPRLPALRRLILASTQTEQQGFTARTPEAERIRPGASGVSVTPLRPVGKAEIDGETMVVQTDGRYIEPGVAVAVIEVAGNRVIVAPADEGPASRAAGEPT